ncbi:MAG TPA: M23 family metallopeptidase [Lentimicrobium sp.]|nr:M23 family metallopeptidase [Lentimicrobium sp.]
MGRKKKIVETEFPETKVKWYRKLRDKYRLVILNEDTFEERLSFRLSRLNVFVITGMLAIIFIFLTTYLIAFTPLKEYIPGYNDTGVQEDIYELTLHADSLEKAMRAKDLYIENMRKIVTGDIVLPDEKNLTDTVDHEKYSNITLRKSKEDSLLRAEYEQSNRYNLSSINKETSKIVSPSVGIPVFFTPVKGIITNHFNVSSKHFGVDIAASKNEAVKAVYDGTVIFSEWSSSTGHVIAIQHINNVISVYKHNSVILKKQGSFVKAGESVAIIGESGEFSTGPHLHFELWINGNPVNPENYVIF